MSDSETRRPRHALVDDEVVAPETDSADVDVPGVDVPKIDVPAPSEPRDDVVEPAVVEPDAVEPDVPKQAVVEPAVEEAPAGTDVAADLTDSPTTALPVQRAAWPGPPAPGEYTDDATMVLPVIPAQRAVSPMGHPMPGGRARPALPGHSYPAPRPVAPKSRVLPAVLAAATAVLLVAGIAVGIGGVPGEIATPPAPTANP